METAAVSAVPPYSGLRNLAEPLVESAPRHRVTPWGWLQTPLVEPVPIRTVPSKPLKVHCPFTVKHNTLTD